MCMHAQYKHTAAALTYHFRKHTHTNAQENSFSDVATLRQRSHNEKKIHTHTYTIIYTRLEAAGIILNVYINFCMSLPHTRFTFTVTRCNIFIRVTIHSIL